MANKLQYLHGIFFDKSVEGVPLHILQRAWKISHLEPKLQSFSGGGILTFVQTSIEDTANEI